MGALELIETATAAASITRRTFVGAAAMSAVLAVAAPASAKATEAAQAVTGPYLAACIQFNPAMYRLEENVAGLCAILEQAFEAGAKLAVCPEMCTTGYSYTSRKDIAPYVDTIPGMATDTVGELCARYGAYVCFGIAEKDAETDIYYNAAALVGPEGLVGKYRKVHQWETEEHWSAWGDLGFPVFQTELGVLGINICMDSSYFESARTLAVQGCDVLLFPTNSSGGAIAALPARAVQNGMYVVSGNRSNTELGFHMIGGSAVWDPEGTPVTMAPLCMTSDDDMDEATFYLGEIDPSKFQNANSARLATRRPELYQDLMLHIGPWDYTKTTQSSHVKAVALQYSPADTVEETAEKVMGLVDGLDGDVDLVVLPELSLTGIVESPEPYGDTALEVASDIAIRLSAAVVIGAVEEGGDGALYNSAFVVDSAGALVGTYRKTHLGEDDAWATPGDAIEVFSLEGIGRVGVLLGDDVCYPEAAGVLAVNRADVICNPAAWYGQYGCFMQTPTELSASPFAPNAMVLWDAVSEGAEAYTVTANFVGGDAGYLGSSALNTLDPLYVSDVQSCASKDEEEAFACEFDTLLLDGWYNQEMLINSRRTDYYKPLVVAR